MHKYIVSTGLLFYVKKQKGDLHVSDKKKLKLNVKFINGQVVCAKSPGECKECKEECETMDLFYYPYKSRDIIECFKNNERRR